ncbi:MAG: hypothetical protein U0350_39975 [Caldilineaceae bacterium]
MTQPYVALVTIGNDHGPPYWPGSEIELDDERALLFLARGFVAPLANTIVPQPPPLPTADEEAAVQPQPTGQEHE